MGQIQIIAEVYPSGVKKSLASNIASATGSTEYYRVGNSTAWRRTGVITLPSDTSRMREIRLYLVGPDDSSASTPAGTISVAGLAGGSTVPYTTSAPTTMWQERVQRGWRLQFHAVDDRGLVAATPYEMSFTIRASAVTGLTGSESADPRVADARGSAYTKMVYNVSLDGNQVPQMIGLWYDRGLGDGWVYFGLVDVASYPSGDLVTPSVPIPTGADGSWKLAAATVVGASGGFDGLAPGTLPSGAVQSSVISVPRAALNPTNLVSNAQIGTIKYFNASNGWMWGWPSLTWDIANPEDPTYWSTFITVQKGHYSGSTWVPASDDEGDELRSFAEAGKDGTCTQFTSIAILTGGTHRVSVQSNMDWPVPGEFNPDGTTNVDRIYKLKIYGRSMRGANDKTGGSGTPTQQLSCWPGGAAFLDVTPVTQPGNVDLTKTIASTRGAGLGVDADGKLAVDGVTAGMVDSLPLTAVRDQVAAFLGVEVEIGTDGNLHIKNGGIKTTMIDYAQIIDAHIFSVSASKITTGTLGVSISISVAGDSVTIDHTGMNVTPGGHGYASYGVTVQCNGINVGAATGYAGSIACEGNLDYGANLSGLGFTSVAGVVEFKSLSLISGNASITATGAGTFTSLTVGATNVMTAISAKADSSALSSYLTTSAAASTYETQSHASSTYETQSHASSTYMPIGGNSTDASASIYLVAGDGYAHSFGFTNGRLVSYTLTPP